MFRRLFVVGIVTGLLISGRALASSVSFQIIIDTPVAPPVAEATEEAAVPPAPPAYDPAYDGYGWYYPQGYNQLTVPPPIYVPPLMARPVPPRPMELDITPHGVVRRPSNRFYQYYIPRYPEFQTNGYTYYPMPMYPPYPIIIDRR